MEEILASIRRIISEDEAPAAAAEPAAAPQPAVEDSPAEDAFPALPDEPEAPAPVMEAADDDVLELTDPYEAPATAAPTESIGDLDVTERPFDEPKPAPVAEPEPAPAMPTSYEPESDDTLVSDVAAQTAASAFAGLSASLKLPSEGRSLEDLVREMMRPLLKDWLDQNLPRIVEDQVRAEVERIARRGVR